VKNPDKKIHLNDFPKKGKHERNHSKVIVEEFHECRITFIMQQDWRGLI